MGGALHASPGGAPRTLSEPPAPWSSSPLTTEESFEMLPGAADPDAKKLELCKNLLEKLWRSGLMKKYKNKNL